MSCCGRGSRYLSTVLDLRMGEGGGGGGGGGKVDEDCGECKHCLDKPKFGGQDLARQMCRKKQDILKERIVNGIALYEGALRTAIKDKQWDAIPALLEKGSKGKGNSKTGEGGSGVAASDLRSACRAYGLFANTVLQSENDSGTTTANLRG